MSELKRIEISDMGTIIDYTFKVLTLTISLYALYRTLKKQARKKE